MTTVSNLVAPTWWNAYAAPAFDAESAEARKREEKLYRAEVPGAPDNASYHGYVYAKNGLLTNATDPVEVPSNALYLKNGDGSYFTIDFGDEAKVSLIDKGSNLQLYVYISEGSAERYEFDKKTGSLVDETPTELNALEISAIEKKSKVDIDFDAKTGASMSATLSDGGRSADSLYKLNVLGADVYAVGSRLNADKGIDINDYALMADAENLWEPDEDYDDFSVVKRSVTIIDEPAVDAVVDPITGDVIERARKEVTHRETRYDVYLSLDADPDRNYDGETLRLTFDHSRTLIQTGAEAPVYLDRAALARDEAVTNLDHNRDGAVGLNISTTAVDATGDLYTGSILGQEFYVFGNFGNHDSATKGASLSGALLEADGETAWEAYAGFAVVAGLDTSYEDAGEVVEQRTILLQSDDNANEVLRFDFVVHTSALTDARGNAITSFKLVENADTGKELTPQELAALEKAHKRDADGDGNFGVGMATSPIDGKGGLQLANALGVSFLMASKRAVSSERSPLDLSTAFTLEPNTDGTRDSWMPENVADLTSSNIQLITTDDGAGSTVYEIYVEEDASTGGAFARYSFDESFAMIEDRYELTDDELAAAEVKYRRNLNADEYIQGARTRASYGVVINDEFLDRKSGLYSAEFEGQSMFIKSDSRLREGSFSDRKAVDFDAVLHDNQGAVWNLDEFKIESDMVVTGAVQDGDSFLVFATSAADPSLVQKFTFEQDNGNSDRWTLTGSAHEELLSLAELSTLESNHRKDLNGDDYKGAKFISREDKTSGLTKVEMADKEFYIVEPERGNRSRLDHALYANSQGDAWVPDEAAFTSMVSALNPENGSERFVYVVNQPEAGGNPDYANYSYTRYTFDAATGVLHEGSNIAIDLVDLAAEEVATGRDINLDRAIGAKVTKRIDRAAGLYETEMDGVTAYAVSGTKERALDLKAHAFLNPNGDSPWEGAETGYKLSALVVDGGANPLDDSDNSYAIYATNTVGGAAADVKVYRFDSERRFVEAADVTSATIGDDKGLVDLEIELDRDLNRDRAVGQRKDDTVDRRGGLFTTTVMGDTFYTIGSKLRTGRSADTGISLSMSLFDATGQNPWAPATGFEVAGVVANPNAAEGGRIDSYSVFSYSDSDNNGDPEHVEETIWRVTSHDADNKPLTLEFDTSKTADAVRLVELEKAERRDLSGDGVVGFRLDTAANEASDRNYFGVSKAKIFGNFTVFLAGENLRQGRLASPLAQGHTLLSQDGSSPWSIDTGYQIVGAELSPDGTERYVYGKLTTNELDTRSEFIEYTFNKDSGTLQGSREISRNELMEREVAERKDLTADGSIGIKLANVSEINNNQGKWTGLIQATVGIGGEMVLAEDDAATAAVNESVASTQTYLMFKQDPRPNKGDLSQALLTIDGQAWELPSSGFEIKGTHVGYWDPNDPVSRYLDVYGFESDTDAEISRYRFTEWLPNNYDPTNNGYDPLYGNWVLSENQYDGHVDMNTRQLAEAEADAGKDLNGDGSIGFVYDSAVASESNGMTLGTANAKQASDVTGADSDIYIVGRNLDRMGTRTSNLANAAALFVESGGHRNYWKPDAGFDVTQIWQNGDAVHLYAQNTNGSKTLKYTFHSEPRDGSPTWIMTSATRGNSGMGSVEIVKDEAAARRDFNEDSFVGLDIGSSPTVGVFNATVEGDNYMVIGPDLVDGTASKPTDFTGVLLSNGEAWEAPAGYEVLAFIKGDNDTRVYITDNTPDDGSAMPKIFRLFFNEQHNHEFGDVNVFNLGSTLVDPSKLELAEGEEGYDADVDAANQDAYMTLSKFMDDETHFRRDLDGNGVVGMTIDPATNPVAPAVYSGTAFGQTAIMVSPDRVLETGTRAEPTSLNGAVITNIAAEGEDPVYDFWTAGTDQTITGAAWSTGGVISFFVKDTSLADSHVVKKYALTELEEHSQFKRVLATGENDVEDLTGASLIQEEVERRMDLDGNGVVGVEISSDANDHITGQLYKGLGLNANEVFYLVGYGLESGTASNPLGLETALRAEDYTDDAPTYWTPDGAALVDFEGLTRGNDSFSQSVIDAIQDDAVDGEETPPDGAAYAATLDDGSVVFFDWDRKIITA